MKNHLATGSCLPAKRLLALAVLVQAALLTACSDAGFSAMPAATGGRTRTAPPPITAQGAAGAAAAGSALAAVARGKVEVQGGLAEIMASQDGTVEELAVAPGDEVRRGQVLVRLSPESVAQDAAVARAELQLALAREQAQLQRIAPAQRLMDRLSEAARAGATDAQRADEAQQALQDAQATAAVAKAEVGVARQRLAQASSHMARLSVTAREDASVLYVYTQPGARALSQGGKPLMVLLPRRPLLVRAELNETFLSSVKTGMRASVVSDAGGSAAPPVAGRVIRMSPAFGASRLDEDNPARAGLRVVECWIAFDQTPQLRVGQDVRVSFHEQ